MPRIGELVGQVLNSPELCTCCTAFHSIKIDLALLTGLTPPLAVAKQRDERESDGMYKDLSPTLDVAPPKGS